MILLLNRWRKMGVLRAKVARRTPTPQLVEMVRYRPIIAKKERW
jgi:hypothetical protein